MADHFPEGSRAHVENSSTVISAAPISIPSQGQGKELQLRVSAPVSGDALPIIIIFSHDNGQSLYAYGPLGDHWAAHGSVVIQPAHLDSRMLGLGAGDPRKPQFWRFRENDLVSILDGLDRIEEAVPAVRGRLDRNRIAVAGHSWGGQTASMLLGATHPDPDDGSVVDIKDARIKAGVLLAVPGTGGDNLSPFAAQNFPFMHPDFSRMDTPALVVAGDNDHGAMTVRGPEWWREAYDASPGPKASSRCLEANIRLTAFPTTKPGKRPMNDPSGSRRSNGFRRPIFAARCIPLTPLGGRPSRS